MFEPLFIKLQPDNFIDLAQTPWGGTTIANTIKSQLNIDFPKFIGESLEFSALNESPSAFVENLPISTLPQLLARPEMAKTWLSPEHIDRWGTQIPLLIKYIDAKRNLSLQIHPNLDDASLPCDFCGKWEAWLVLKHEPNAGVYLGLKPGLGKEDLRAAIASQQNIEDYLNFIPVNDGDLISIPPQKPHALGAGVCVLEPQLIVPGKRPVSLRLHDWNHRYDSNGNLSPSGTPRKLNIDAALALLDTAPFDETVFIHRNAQNKKADATPSTLHTQTFSPMPFVVMQIIHGTGDFLQEKFCDLTSIIAVEGSVSIQIQQIKYTLNQGESAIIASSAQNVAFEFRNAHVVLTHCNTQIPSFSTLMPINPSP